MLISGDSTYIRSSYNPLRGEKCGKGSEYNLVEYHINSIGLLELAIDSKIHRG